MAYDQAKHDRSTSVSLPSAREILPYLIETFNPDSFVDVGAGYCNWAHTASELGVQDVAAVDGPWTDLSRIKIPRDRFHVHELDRPLDLGRRFDMALSLEVGEHIRTDASRTLVQSLCRASDLVVFGAATPLQGGFMHINEQWQSYWQTIFADEGYILFDLIRPKFWNNDHVIYYYRQNAFVYVKQDRSDLIGICRAEIAAAPSNPLIDAIHPAKYLEMAGYDVVLMKHLVRKLPGHVLRTAGRKLGLSR